jgi:NAD(P)-dependent dehydrogenase (short-subunit alcohol dehydrogenase family)
MTRSDWTLADKVVLITGGGRGIGAATAAELARRGAIPVLADVDEAALKETGTRIAQATTLLLDVSDYAACERAVVEILDRHGRLDIVWANAGIGAGGPVELMDADVWARVINVNLLGAYNTVRAGLAAVIAAQGYVALTASVASFAHPPAMSAYAASKAGVEALGDALRIEVAHQGVDVGVLHPTWIATDMVRDADAESRAFQRLRRAMRPPFARTYPVESIVDTIADAFAARQRRIFLPGFVRIAFLARAMVHSRAVERDLRKAAPEIRSVFAQQAAEEGARRAALGSRWTR